MKALVKIERGIGLSLEEVPLPEVGINDLLVKVTHTAICGTDLHIYNWDEWSQRTIKTPRIIGHEFVGIVVEKGAGVVNFEIGDRVTCEGHITCGTCRNCRMGKPHLCPNTIGIGVNRDGAFAEYISIPKRNTIKIHPDIDDDIVAIFDPLGNAVHAALSFPLIGEDVLITGSGLIGSMAVAICRFAGARHIVATDLSDYRLKLAKKMGASVTINPLKEQLTDAIKALDISNGFDVGLEMSGSGKAFKEMLEVMFHGGHIALLGILPNDTAINWDQVIFKGLTLKGIYGREMFETWYKMEQMIRSGLDVSRIITHRFHYSDFEKGFKVMQQAKCGKVILNWED